MSMNLGEIVQKYLAAAGAYGKKIPLASLGLAKDELESALGAFDDDYHISRFLHFTCADGSGSPLAYQINGFPQTHISIDSDVQSIL
jgi:hypothetical protein